MNFLANKQIAEWLAGLGRLALLAREAFLSFFTFKIAWRDLLYQIYFIGVKSQAVVLITGAFTGMVLGAQTYFQFHKVKMDTATLAVVGRLAVRRTRAGADGADGRRARRRGHRRRNRHDARDGAD